MTFYRLCLPCGNRSDEIPATVGYCCLGAEAGFPRREGAMSWLQELTRAASIWQPLAPVANSFTDIASRDRSKVYWCISD
jgi:hypothetical protein